MEDALMEELDASVAFGSGYICVVGPPSSGKTNVVLRYLVDREERFNRDAPTPSSSSPTEEERTFHMEYWTARSFGRDALSQMAHRLEAAAGASAAKRANGGPARRRRRFAYDCTPLEFGYCVTHWHEAHAAGSELHLVIDDADALDLQSESVNAWLSNCLHTEVAAGKTLCLWLISQLPLRLSSCFRFHFVSPLSVEAVCAWLSEEQRVHGHVLRQEEEALRKELNTHLDGQDNDEPIGGEKKTSTVTGPASTAARRACLLTAEAAGECVAKAVRYYATHQPMCASVVGKDVRLLLRRVYQLLPALVRMGGELVWPRDEGSTAAAEVRVGLNAIHLSSAWGRHRELALPDEGGRQTSTRDGHPLPASSGAQGSDPADPLVSALLRIGYSAVLLAFVAFYCGAVPKRKQFEAFGTARGTELRATSRTEAHAQSHKAAVLSAASQVIALPRLLHMYEAVLKMCVEHMDPLEFASAEVAAHYVHGFQAWGLLTPVISQHSRKRYHCWIPVSTAVQLGKVLSLNLFDLIPL